MKNEKIYNGNINHKLETVIIYDVKYLRKSFDITYEQQLKLKREISFYKYCEKLGINNVPNLYNSDNNSITIEFIKGDSINYLDLNNLYYFTNFINDLNPFNLNNKAKYNIHAGEAVLSKNMLFENINTRSLILSETRMYHPKNLVFTIDKLLNLFSSEVINVGKIIVSPSDFGVHNFILKDKDPYFIDFEYSGKDSILKCILDFVLHPANNIDFEDLELYIENFKNSLNLNDFKISKYTINIFCIWWILRLLNSITNNAINFRIAKGLILLNERDEFIENRVKNIQKFYNYI